MDEKTAQSILDAIRVMSESIAALNSNLSRSNDSTSGNSPDDATNADDKKKESVLQAYLMQFGSDKVKSIIKSVSAHFDLDSLMNWMDSNRDSLKKMDTDENSRELSKEEKIQLAMKNGDVENLKILLSEDKSDNADKPDETKEDNDKSEDEGVQADDKSDDEDQETEEEEIEDEPLSEDILDVNKMIKRKDKVSRKTTKQKKRSRKADIPETPRDKDDDEINERVSGFKRKSRKIISYF